MAYGTVSRLFHWSMAVLILAMIPVGFVMTQEGLSRPVQDSLFIFHKNTGALLLVLIVLRIGWRVANPPPPLPGHMPRAMQLAARSVHVGLYAAVAVMAASGYARVRMGGFPIEYLDALGVPSFLPESERGAEIAQSIHLTTAWVVVGLIALHVAAAAYHGLVRRDGLFGRMWPPVAPRGRRQVG